MTPKASKTLPLAEAARIWSLYGLTSPKDLHLEDLAMAMNVFVVDARLDSAAARLVRKGDYGLIRVSDDLRFTGQRRFAIAHEIGHFVMHKRVSQLLACTDADMRASYRSSPYEIEASAFAGALLMPSELFMARIAGTVPAAEIIKELASRKFQNSDLPSLPSRFSRETCPHCLT